MKSKAYKITALQDLQDGNMKNYDINYSFVCPKRLKAQTKKTDFDYIIFILIFAENCQYTMLFIIFQYGSEPIIIHQILVKIIK